MDITTIVTLISTFVNLFCPDASSESIAKALAKPSRLEIREAAMSMARANGDKPIRWRRYIDDVQKEIKDMTDEDRAKIATAVIAKLRS